jgi:hypothetical protein
MRSGGKRKEWPKKWWRSSPKAIPKKKIINDTDIRACEKIIDEVVAEDCAGAFSSILASSAKSAIESEQVAVHEAQTQHFALQSQESNQIIGIPDDDVNFEELVYKAGGVPGSVETTGASAHPGNYGSKAPPAYFHGFSESNNPVRSHSGNFGNMASPSNFHGFSQFNNPDRSYFGNFGNMAPPSNFHGFSQSNNPDRSHFGNFGNMAPPYNFHGFSQLNNPDRSHFSNFGTMAPPSNFHGFSQFDNPDSQPGAQPDDSSTMVPPSPSQVGGRPDSKASPKASTPETVTDSYFVKHHWIKSWGAKASKLPGGTKGRKENVPKAPEDVAYYKHPKKCALYAFKKKEGSKCPGVLLRDVCKESQLICAHCAVFLHAECHTMYHMFYAKERLHL